MTYVDEPEIRRASVGTKVLIFGFAILAVLGSFWTIVWFIRSYVEAPRVAMPAAMVLAARDSTPIVPPAATVPPAPMRAADPQPTKSAPPPAPPKVITAEPAPVSAPATRPVAASPSKTTMREQAESPPTGAIAERWFPANPPPAPPPAPAPVAAAPVPVAAPAPIVATAPMAAPVVALPDPVPTPAIVMPAHTAAPALAAPPDNDPPIEEVAEGSVPAIAGRAPLPRRKPLQTAAARSSRADPPLPRPRPDGPAPQSIWSAVPVSDDRFPTQ